MESNPETTDRFLVALSKAAAWCDDPANREELAALLERPDYVGQPATRLMPALDGRVVLRHGDTPVDVPDFLLFHRDAANFPWRSQALWIYSQFVRWKLVKPNERHERQAAEVFRSDIYRRALAEADLPMPGASMKVEGALRTETAVGSHHASLTLGPDRFFDDKVFDPQNINAYLDLFKHKPV
jgi:NitT/TauT family transport system ATP-binding protein